MNKGLLRNPDGIIKFTPKCISSNPPPFSKELDDCREMLKAAGYLFFKDDVGSGNVALMEKDGSVIVTASQTQGKQHLDANDYVRISNNCDTDSDEVPYEGVEKPSSEVRTLISMMRARPGIRAVAHVHFDKGWESELLATKGKYSYGTVGFAHEAQDIIIAQGKDYGIFKTPGHGDGIFSYAPTIRKAYEIMLEFCNRIKGLT